MLSAFDFGERATNKGRPNAFSHLTDFDKSLAFITDYIQIWEKWMREKNVLIARYEDLLTNYEAESTRLADYLGLKGDQARSPRGDRALSPRTGGRPAGYTLFQG